MRVTCNACGAVHQIAPPAWVVDAGRPFRMVCPSCRAAQEVIPTGLAVLEECAEAEVDDDLPAAASFLVGGGPGVAADPGPSIAMPAPSSAPPPDPAGAAGPVLAMPLPAVSGGPREHVGPEDVSSTAGASEVSAEVASSDSIAEAPEPPARAEGRFVLRLDGELFDVGDLGTLQRWVLEGRLDGADELSELGGPWHRADSREDLRSLLETAAAMALGVEMSPEPALPVDGSWLPELDEDADTEETQPPNEFSDLGPALDGFDVPTVPDAGADVLADGSEPSRDRDRRPPFIMRWALPLASALAVAAMVLTLVAERPWMDEVTSPTPVTDAGAPAVGSLPLTSVARQDAAPAVVAAPSSRPTPTPSHAAVASIPGPPREVEPPRPVPPPRVAEPEAAAVQVETVQVEAVKSEAVQAPEPPAPAPPSEPAVVEPSGDDGVVSADPAASAPEPLRPRIAPRVPVPEPEPEPELVEPSPSGTGDELPATIDPDTLITLGWAALDRHDVAGAIQAFERAIALEPNDVGSNYGLGYALLQRGRVTQARPLLCRAHARASGSDLDEIEALLSQHGLACR